MSKLMQPSKVYKPFMAPWAVEVTQQHERMHWIEEEIETTDDVNDWKLGRLTESEKNFITQILRMFTQSDVAVGSFYFDVLIPKFKNNEVRNMLSSFATREGIHQRAYALLNDTLGLPEGDYAAFMSYKEMADKADFMMTADPDTLTGLGLSMAKAVCNEGISLFASFAMLLNFQRRGLMKAMGKVVEWSTKDESKHVEGVSLLFRSYCNDHPRIVTDAFKKSIYDMVRTCVELEDAFIDLAYEMGPVEGLPKEDVKRFIRFIADRRLTQLGLKPNWGIEANPLPWIDWVLNGADLTNFFENKVAEYEVGGLDGDWSYGVPAKNHRFVVFTRPGCSYCVDAKALLDRVGVRYEEQVLESVTERNTFYNARGFKDIQRTMPKIYEVMPIGFMELVGGYTELSEMLADE